MIILALFKKNLLNSTHEVMEGNEKMGFIDSIILGSTGVIFFITLVTFLMSINSTNEPAKKRYIKSIYIPTLVICLVVFVSYIVVVSTGNFILNELK